MLNTERQETFEYKTVFTLKFQPLAQPEMPAVIVHAPSSLPFLASKST